LDTREFRSGCEIGSSGGPLAKATALKLSDPKTRARAPTFKSASYSAASDPTNTIIKYNYAKNSGMPFLIHSLFHIYLIVSYLFYRKERWQIDEN
jgi:hypothetical protein